MTNIGDSNKEITFSSVFGEWQERDILFCRPCNLCPFLLILTLNRNMRLGCRSSRKHNHESSHRYNLRIRIPTLSPHASQSSPPTTWAIQPASNRLRSTSIGSTSSLSSIFPTPPASPSARIPPVQSYPLESEIKTTHIISGIP